MVFSLWWSWALGQELVEAVTAGSEIGSSQLGKTEDHGVWLSMKAWSKPQTKTSVSSHGAQSWAWVERQDSRNGSQGSSPLHQLDLLIESSRNLCWLSRENRGFIIRWLRGFGKLIGGLEDLTLHKSRIIHWKVNSQWLKDQNVKGKTIKYFGR